VFYSDPSGDNEVMLTNNQYYDFPQAFSPDETRVLVISRRSGSYDLWVIDINGNYLTNLTNDAAREIGGDWIKQNEPPIAICKDIEITVDELWSILSANFKLA